MNISPAGSARSLSDTMPGPFICAQSYDEQPPSLLSILLALNGMRLEGPRASLDLTHVLCESPQTPKRKTEYEIDCTRNR